MRLCANRIEKGLNKMSGISNATVNLALENATVEFHPSEVSLSDIIQRIEKLGYGAHVKENDQEELDYRVQEIYKQKSKFIIAAYLFFTIIVDDGRAFSVYFFHLYAEVFNESLGANGVCYSGAIYYWMAVLCWCI